MTSPLFESFIMKPPIHNDAPSEAPSDENKSIEKDVTPDTTKSRKYGSEISLFFVRPTVMMGKQTNQNFFT